MDWLNLASHYGYKQNYYHAMLLDPPYHLTSITNRFGKSNMDNKDTPNRSPHYKRLSKGFMGQTWDGGDLAFNPELWIALKKMLLPGAFCFAFAGSRGWHRMAVAIEDAGFIMHPTLWNYWNYASGFPKATRIKKDGRDIPEWQSHRYGLQAIKPAVEPILCFQKPYEGKPVDSIVLTGAGALNIDKGRIGIRDKNESGWSKSGSKASANRAMNGPNYEREPKSEVGLGRWPSNLLLQHSPGCKKVGVKSEPNRFPYSFKDSIYISIVDDSIDCNIVFQKRKVNLSITWLDSASVMVFGIINFDNNIKDRKVEIDNEGSLISNDHPLMDKLNISLLQLISNFKLNFWNGERFPTGKTFTTMNGHLEEITFSARNSTSVGAMNISDGILNSVGRNFKILFADRTDEGNFISSMSDLEFVSTFFTTRFPGRFNRQTSLDSSNKSFIANRANLIDFSHIESPDDIVHSHAPIVNVADWQCVDSCPVRRLGEQSGYLPTSARPNLTGKLFDRKKDVQIYGKYGDIPFNSTHNDSGTASRFFFQSHFAYEIAEQIAASDPVRYVAKAGSTERNAGLDALSNQTRHRVNAGGLENEPRWGPVETKNIHPTVKPIALTKYLASLLLPPDSYAPRRILVPFAGSGSEMIGALLAGWDEITGIEMTKEYVKIAKARCEFWVSIAEKVRVFGLDSILQKYSKTETPRDQLSFFDDV